MIRSLTVFPVLLLALACATADAAGPDSSPASLLEVCGVNAGMSELDKQVANGSKTLPAGIRPELKDAIASALRGAGFAKAVSARVSRQVAEMSADELAAVHAWCNSPLGRKITKEELRLSRPNAEAALAAYAQSIRDKPPSAVRTTLVERISKASAAVPVTVAIFEGIGLGIASGMNATVPEERRRPAEDLERDLAPQHARIESGVAAYMQVALHYTYARLRDEDLARYAELLESPAGRAFSAAIATGYIEGMISASRQVGVEIARNLDRKSL